MDSRRPLSARYASGIADGGIFHAVSGLLPPITWLTLGGIRGGESGPARNAGPSKSQSERESTNSSASGSRMRDGLRDPVIPGQVKAAQGTQVPRRPAAPLEEARPKSVGGVLPRRPALRTMRSESALAVKSKLGDDTSADDLRRWIVAVAYGKPVLVDSGRGPVERFRLKPALGRVYNIRFTQTFASRHPQLQKLTSEIAECDGSKWRVWSCGSPGAPRRNAVEIDSSASFVHLLRSMMVRG